MDKRPFFNMQCKWFAVVSNNPDDFKPRVESLIRQFDWVGVTDEYAESLLLLRDLYGVDNINYIKKNVLRNRPRSLHVSEDILSQIQQHSRCDFYFYQRAREILRKRLNKQYGANLPQALVDFNKTQPVGECGRHDISGKCAYTVDRIVASTKTANQIHVLKMLEENRILYMRPADLDLLPLKETIQHYSIKNWLTIAGTQRLSDLEIFSKRARFSGWRIMMASGTFQDIANAKHSKPLIIIMYIMDPLEVFQYNRQRDSKKSYSSLSDYMSQVYKANDHLQPSFNPQCSMLLGGRMGGWEKVDFVEMLRSVRWIGLRQQAKESMKRLGDVLYGNRTFEFPLLQGYFAKANQELNKISPEMLRLMKTKPNCDSRLYDAAVKLFSKIVSPT
eukprot:TRINITY_DN7135_c0_g2_i1.p1 TRINITY_DN7135_c0_g2~~TRINITY_DN7135_c0_g2_i1.p1  ORF type:complete len:390 (-),score=69.90 TRINITY_DN7135_c0_g2_i1:16-1185(-)